MLSFSRILLFSFGSLACLQAADIPKDLFEEKCLSCHHPEKKKGKLDLSTRDNLLTGGDAGPAIDLERVEKSEILLRVRLPHDDDDIMPPEKKGKPLTAEEISALTAWIKEGAKG